MHSTIFEKPSTIDQGISYTEMISKHKLLHDFKMDDATAMKKIFVHDAYIPLVHSDYFSFPLLACYDAYDQIMFGRLHDFLSNQATEGGFNLVNEASDVLNSPDLRHRQDINVFSAFYYFGDLKEDETDFDRKQKFRWLKDE